MKKSLFIACICLLAVTSISANPLPEVNEKIMKNFKESFPNVIKAKWTDMSSYYQVFFQETDRMTRIDYDLKGNIIRTLLNYNEDGLPVFIRGRVHKAYPGKNVYGVTELTTAVEHTYQVVLQDEKYWYKIFSDSAGNLSLQSKLRKA